MPNGCKSLTIRIRKDFRRFLVIYEFQLHSTHGDTYYIGLNGLELYDEHGEMIGLTEQSKYVSFE